MRGALTNCRVQSDGQVKTSKRSERAGALTFCPAQEGQVRIPRGSERTRGTHLLSSADEGTCQNTMNKRGCEGRLLPIKRRGEGHVRNPRESEKAKDTHSLSSAEGRSNQKTERERESEGHSLPVERRTRERRTRDRSENQEKARERGALTNCRAYRDK